jgi:hypothetical protein
MKTTLAIRMLLASSGLSSAMPASAAELDGALVGAVFAGDPAIYAPPPVDLSPSARACRNPQRLHLSNRAALFKQTGPPQ